MLVKVLAYAGLRWDEGVALRGGSIDVLRRRIHVRESATMVNGDLVWGPPKSHRARTIVILRFLADELAPLIEGADLIFTSPTGKPLRSSNFHRRVWKPEVTDRGVGDLVPHDLRHTAASLQSLQGHR